jgi:hypothetical protein
MKIRGMLFSIAGFVLLGASALAATPDQAAPQDAGESRPVTIADLEKRIEALEKQLASLHRNLLTGAQISAIARREAGLQINRVLDQTVSDGSRLPISDARGNVRLRHVFVGGDNPAGETPGAEGLRIAVAGRGPEFTGGALLYVYAMPVSDLVMKPEYLIYHDAAMPFIDGVAQTHFIWNGTYISGTRLAPGNYKIFARIIVRNAKGEVAGSAMRYWGGTAGEQADRFNVVIR